jgi:hypothetical protein
VTAPLRSYGDGVIEDATGREVARTGEPDGPRPDLHRIIECVNALDGVTDPGAVLASIAGFLEDVAGGCDPDEARAIAADLLSLLEPKV